MFQSKVSPSPTRSSIKEANDHLQLLHVKVAELERTVQEQAEALIKKDEAMQTRIRDVGDAKDARIAELEAQLTVAEERLRKQEEQLRDRDMQLELLSHRYALVDEVAAYTPVVEKLLAAMRRLPAKTPSRQAPRSRANSRGNLTVAPRKSSTPGTPNHDGVGNSVLVDGHALSELRIGRSFSINSNFSASEDEADVVGAML
ncbi:vimentin-type intermediate filament-associated coiled-coil protein-like [Rhipicephalus sanguineus]|uniref:vimentin-type intermediate filament-associated coiled-coil protein-like n=1 Tax=Rhipicephalus sanguineus TaxID=34632 RepID=UPI001894DE4A|nr:vimentin-type intermediate filament-associated coiled-coil protein-like [Rhipicephalus sanguineus]